LKVRGFWFYGRLIVKTSAKRLVFLLAFSFVTYGFAQKVEPALKPTVPDTLLKALSSQGNKVLDKDGTVIASVWAAKEVRTAKKEVEGANYPQLDVAEFLGVIQFEQEARDFRGQTIPKGTYTLRYGLLPNDGNHMGVAPNRDFLLVLSPTSDADPEATYTEKQLYRASEKAAGTPHPAVLSLVADEGKHGTVTTTSEGFVVLHFSVPSSDGPLSVALIVKGVAQQ
jgi:hypothetical protein